MFRRILLLLLASLAGGCATTTVTRDPPPWDKGIRYYRPKPYLFIQPAENGSDAFVRVSLEYLPDFSEEYSIRARAGLGINQTSIKLADGWNLVEIDQKLDAQFDESLKAVGELVGNLPIPTAGKTADMPRTKMVVRATNVPLGFYEAVLSRGPNGRKRLYGWRYVGFYPFAACPMHAAGEDCIDCHAADVYALTFRRGVMTFQPIATAAYQGDTHRDVLDPESLSRLPPVEAVGRPAMDRIREKVVQRLQNTSWGTRIAPGQIDVRFEEPKTIVIAVRLDANTAPSSADVDTAKRDLEAGMLTDVRRAVLDDQFNVRVELAP